jgi:hypothetical protein
MEAMNFLDILFKFLLSVIRESGTEVEYAFNIKSDDMIILQ